MTRRRKTWISGTPIPQPNPHRVPITREDERRALDKGIAEERALGWRFKPERSAEEESALADKLHHSIPQPTPPCQRCGQPSDPGVRICAQCIRDDERDAIHSHAVKGQPHQ